MTTRIDTLNDAGPAQEPPQEVQGLPGGDVVSSAMQRALADPRLPAVLVPGGGSLRVEVNLADEVLVLYRGNQVALPVSHGCVRIPMDIAAFFHTLVPAPGTPVYIRS